MSTDRQPLILPDDFDPEVNLLGRDENGAVFHATIPGMNLAVELMRNGTPADLERAGQVMDAVFESQERREGAAHFGNFKWEREDEAVEDLNAVHFTIMPLIRALHDIGGKLPEDLRQRAEKGIRFGLQAIARIDVHLRYTTIAAADIFDTCIGGELLGDDTVIARGRDKLRRWLAFTDRSGTFYEYNCPGYTGMSIERLAELAQRTADPGTRVLAKVFAARVGLSAFLHAHPSTGRWVGPFSRAYQPQVACQSPPEIGWMRSWLENGSLPEWLSGALESKPLPLFVQETSSTDDRQMMSSYLCDDFAMGVATGDLSSQANRFVEGESSPFIVHSRCEEEVAVVVSKYIVDEKWLGDFRTTPSRSNMQLQPDEGVFRGVQDGTRMLGFYAPRVIGARQPVSGLKLALIWQRRDLVDEIWVDDTRVEALPFDVVEGSTVVVGSGDAWIAVRPLTRTHLSYAPPLRLIERKGMLGLEVYNYEGAPKTFWELGWPGSFYQGLPQCGFYAEVASRSEYAKGSEFARDVATGTVRDEAEQRFTWDGGDERCLWSVEYERDGRRLGLEVDLMRFDLMRRWTEAGELSLPMLESSLARQSRDGNLQVGGAELTCAEAPAWLYACPGGERWAAVYHGPEGGPLRLAVPGGSVEIASLTAGIVVWDHGRVTVEANNLHGTPTVDGGEWIR